MKTELDPVRWTSSNELAPEPLRAAFAAASSEGPSAAQMRLLAFKLAAVAAGTTVATSAATAHAGTSIAGASTAGGALPLAKLMMAVVVVGASALGGVAWWAKPATPPGGGVGPTSRRAPAGAGVLVRHARGGRGGLAPGPSKSSNPAVPEAQTQRPPGVEPVVAVPTEPSDRLAPQRASGTAPGPEARREVPARGSAFIRRRTPTAKTAVTVNSERVEAARSGRGSRKTARPAEMPSEMELLRAARAVLAESPRQSFTLTEQHREHYPHGVFTQERDALAIEALLRSGATETARTLARSFVATYPTSPHAHRFRETLGLP